MGWDYTHATHYTRTGAIDRKAEIDELYTWQNDTRKAEVVRSAMVGSTYYAAIKITELSTGETETAVAVALMLHTPCAPRTRGFVPSTAPPLPLWYKATVTASAVGAHSRRQVPPGV